jgi:outer membrane biosynthesis protein TonB
MVGLIKKVFGGGKNDFYLELEEKKDTATAEVKQPEPEAVTAPVEEKPAEPAAEAPVSEEQPAEPKTKKKSAKKQASVKAETPQPQPVSSAAMIAAAVSSKETQPEAVKTFATNFLMPAPTKYRRRPGPSLKMFQDMARQMNLPRA